jgi:hypothetical protein
LGFQLVSAKSSVWADFTEIFEDINGISTCTKVVCKMCKATLSARSATGSGHLKRHQQSCRLKTDQRVRVQSRLSYNSDGSVYNWDYKLEVARVELYRLIAKLDLPLEIGKNIFNELIILGLLRSLGSPPLEILPSFLMNDVI